MLRCYNTTRSQSFPCSNPLFRWTPKCSGSSWHMQGRQYASWHLLMLILATTQSRQILLSSFPLFSFSFSFGSPDGPPDIKGTTKHCMPDSLFLSITNKEPDMQQWKYEQRNTRWQFRVQESQGAALTFLELPDYSLLCFAEAALSCERHDISSNVNQLLRT